MKYLNFLHSTRLSRLQILDIALVLALLPHLLILKFPMLLYLLLGVVFIFKKKDSRTTVYTFLVIGFIAIAMSFFAEYNFSNFSRLLVFITLLTSLLLHAVILQRLTREITIYLLLSPAMLMILSFFFYNSIGMLFYSLCTLFVFTLLLLYERMQSSWRNALRINALLYLFSLPIVLLLFLVFPRVSYKNASFGFKAEEIKRTGHDGMMFVDSNALLVPSSKLVMEVSFEKDVPAGESLYFRGSTLYIDEGTKWVHGKRSKTHVPKVTNAKDVIKYEVNLYPHNKRFVYMLDLPLTTPENSFLQNDYSILSKLPLTTNMLYRAQSALTYTTESAAEQDLIKALDVNVSRDPRIFRQLTDSIPMQESDTVKAKKLLDFFISLDLTYSMQPGKTDLGHPVDSFLLDSKTGYCVHFAAAFATSARMLGLPSRIVTGYKADSKNAINNYLVITEADAHAWVEVYLKDKGWVRFEPTATARHFLLVQERARSNAYTQLSTIGTFFKKVNIHYMYMRHIITTWVLQYDRNKQVMLLKKALSNTLFLFKFIGSVLGLVLLCIVLFIVFQKRRCDDPLLCEIEGLLKLLKKEGFIRSSGEPMYDFLARIAISDKRYAGLEAINKVYHEERYAKETKERSSLLREKIRSFKVSVTNG